jgi:Type II secretory pathway, prepilin signal peptidase PulO and related peptidases
MVELSPVAQISLITLFGLLLGSFLSMLTWRLPRMMEWEGEAQLKHISSLARIAQAVMQRLSWKELIPVFSWLSSKGQCRHCKTSISARYPLIELSTMLLTLIVVLHFGLDTKGWFALIFTWLLIAITVIDIEHQLILDILSLPLLWLGLIINSQSVFTDPIDAIWGAVIGYMLLWTLFYAFKFLTKKEGMGFGDFKLLAAMGAWFGVEALAQIILIASLSSILWIVALSLFHRRNLQEPVAFGPFLALGGLCTLLLGSSFIFALIG